MIIHGHLVMCTAAHVIDEIRIVMDSGVRLSHWHINDLFTKSSEDVVYPFNVMGQDHFRLRDDQLGLDYCLIYIDWLTAENMRQSGVRAITREQTGDASEADKLVLTGFASDFTHKNGSSISQRHYVLGVTQIERPNNWLPEENQASLFGRLDTAESHDLNTVHIGGMSGGPIFGLYKQTNGNSKIRLVAVQTGWSETTRVITACPIDPFLTAMERLINEVDADAPN
jgi:hypothetical protein